MSVTGDIGSGKSAVSRLLRQATGYPLYPTGALQRRIAARSGMTTLEPNKYSETHSEIDDEIDSESIRLGKTDESFIIDSRIAWHFIPHSFKVYLVVDLGIAAERILGDSGRTGEAYDDLDTAVSDIRKRRQSEVDRFRATYGIDLSDLGNYDLIDKMKGEYGDKAAFISIGPAGEMKMSAASIACTDMETRPTRHAGRGGAGADSRSGHESDPRPAHLRGAWRRTNSGGVPRRRPFHGQRIHGHGTGGN